MSPHLLRPARSSLLLLAGLTACGDVSIKFPDTASPDDTGAPDTADTAGDTDTDTTVPVDPFPGTTPLTDADIILYAAAPSDGVGYAGSVVKGGDLVGTTNDDLVVSARYGDAGGGPYSGAVYIVSDPPSGRSGLADATVTIRGTVDSGQFGTSIATGDFDGDGNRDLAVGAPNGAGAAYVFRGPFAEADLDDLAAARTLVGDGEFSYAGYAMAAAGDVNGDGMDDLAVGAPSSSGGCQSCGAVMVSLSAGGDGTALLDEDAVRIYGDRTYGQVGYSVAPALDVNGDGFPEIAVGAPYSAGGGAGLLYGPFRSGSFDLSDMDAWFAAEGLGTAAGTGIAGADLTGDGYDELIVSAPQDTEGGPYSGKVYVELGSATRWSGENVLGAGAVYMGAGNDAAGTALSPAGDLDGDGTIDLLVGAPYATSGAAYAGAAYLVLGPVTAGTYAFTAEDQTFAGVQAYSYAGQAVAGLGDIDGGGVPDVAMATMMGATPQVGEVFLFLGE